MVDLVESVAVTRMSAAVAETAQIILEFLEAQEVRVLITYMVAVVQAQEETRTEAKAETG